MGYQDTYHSISDVGSWWNFQISFCRMITIIWHHPQVYQEPPFPPRLQEETWRTDGVLTRFLILDLDETFTEASEWWSLSYDTSSKTPGRDLEDWWSLDRVSDVGSWRNFLRSFWMMIPIIWHHLHVHQEPPHPPRLGVLTNDTISRIIRNLDIRWSLARVSDVRSWWNFHRSFWSMIQII